MRRNILLAALFVASLLTVGFARQSQPRWEYHSETFGKISDGKLNDLASEGWELVATANQGAVNQFIFRRPK